MKKSLKKNLAKVIKNHGETFKKLAKNDTQDTYLVFETKVYESDHSVMLGEIVSSQLYSFIGKRVRVIVEAIEE
jgi:formate dehydrogenase maturation protein FdhE